MKYHYPGISVRIVAAMAVGFFFLSTMQVSAQLKVEQQEYCNKSSRGEVGNGYHYELWTNGSGSVCMTVLGIDARFKATWSNVGDMVARVGLIYDETKTAKELGTFTADFAFTKSGLSNLAYFGIYGWSVDPLVEYYILEDWNQWRPDASNHTPMGTITVDGAQYELFTRQQNGQPSIKGNANFTQFWSIRKSTRQSGHISISDHFTQWESKGMKLGKLYEVKLKVEGYNGSGNCEFTKAAVLLNNQPPTPPTSISLVPGETSREQSSFFDNGNTRGDLSLISINGAVVGSVQMNGSESAFPTTRNMAPGMYYLRCQGNGNAPVTKSLLIK